MVNVRVKHGDVADVFQVTATAAPPTAMGKEIGWVSGDKDPLRLAAEALGIKPVLIASGQLADLNSLRSFRTLILGDEAFFKGFANVRAAKESLEWWVASGGQLIVGQLNDEQWSPSLLPLDLLLSDNEDKSADILQADHPIFTTPHRLSDLAGVISYDSIMYADPAWHVLMRNAGGGPAILEASVGAGKVLVILPSFDRPVADPAEADAAARERCKQFMRNVFTYAGYP